MSQTERETLRQRPPDSPVSQEDWDWMIARGIQPATHSFRKHGLPELVRPRPRWLAFLVRIFRRLR